MEKTSSSSRDSEDARAAQDRKSSLKSRVDSAEQEARSQLRSLQPMIQEHHTGWQRLLSQQKKLDSNQYELTNRLEEANRALEMEANMRADLARNIQDLVANLTNMQNFLGQVGTAQPQFEAYRASAPVAAAAVPTRPSAPAGLFDDDDDGDEVPVRAAAPPALAEAPAPVPVAAAPPMQSKEVDDFDAFLQEDTDMTFGAGARTTPTTTRLDPADDPLGLGDEF